MKLFSCFVGGIVVALLILAGTSYLLAQTQADGITQVKNLVVSPIQSVDRWTCQGSGTKTNPDGTTTTWDCNGLSMIRLKLVDGTVIGPFVGITASQTLQNDGKWVSVPLAAATPPKP